MSPENFDIVIRVLLGRRPFRAFTIKLLSGEVFEVDHSRAIYLLQGVIVFNSPGTIPIMFDHQSVGHVIDAPQAMSQTA